MCYCIEQIEETIRNDNRADSTHMMHKGCSEICVTPLTRQMQPAKHRRYKRVDWKYCPFCGELK